jgi:cation transport ATPase
MEGVASVDESAITGESASVIRESGGGRSGSLVARGYSWWHCTRSRIYREDANMLS